MILDAYISKSFYCIGFNQQSCYGCEYCRVGTKQQNFCYTKSPSYINKNFESIPVAVNLFYGDPLFNLTQQYNTYKMLNQLEQELHSGPVLIVTKGNIRKHLQSIIPDDCTLDLHFALSTFGIPHRYDPFSHLQMIKNLKSLSKPENLKYHKSIEFRPICYGINDSKNTIENVFKIANDYNVPIGYSGLQGTPELVDIWNKKGLSFQPFPGFKFGHKKSISIEVQNIFDEMSDKYKVPIFRKTSCLISYVHGLERDYNAHYYRPNEMNCNACVMKSKCFEYKENLSLDKSKIEHLIPFEFDIEYKEKHECILKKQNVCEFPSEDCSNINGNIIKIKDNLTTSDVRVIKWLTGYTVDANFIESSFLSDNWKH